jgi:outer membrane lipoprotein-sorting protein
MKKRYWAVALCVLVLVLVLVSACGGPKSTTTATATATQTATTTATHTATATQTATTTQTATATATATQTATATATATQTATSTATGNTLSGILGLGANIASVKYDMSITAPGMETMVTTVYEKGKKFREEMTTQGMTTIIIMDMDAGVYWMYTPDTNTAMEMTLDTSMIPEGASENPNDILDFNPQIVGTESIDGKSCTVITWDIPDTGTMKEWIWTDKGFPLKIETTTSQGISTIEFTNIDFSDIPDSTFELPAGVIVTTIGA